MRLRRVPCEQLRDARAWTEYKRQLRTAAAEQRTLANPLRTVIGRRPCAGPSGSKADTDGGQRALPTRASSGHGTSNLDARMSLVVHGQASAELMAASTGPGHALLEWSTQSTRYEPSAAKGMRMPSPAASPR